MPAYCRGRPLTIVTISVLLLLAGSAVVAYDFDVGRLSGLSGGVYLSSPTAAENLNCPAVLSPAGRFHLETGCQRRFELADLDNAFIAAGSRFGAVSVYVGWWHLGRSEYYADQIFKTTAAVRFQPFVFSLISSVRKVEIGGRLGRLAMSAAAYGLALGFHHDRYHLGLVADNLNNPRLDAGSTPDQAFCKLYGEIEGISSFSLVGHVAFEKRAGPVVSIGQYVILSEKAAFFWGMGENPRIYSGGLETGAVGLRLLYAVSYHPVLGFTHNISLNWRMDK